VTVRIPEDDDERPEGTGVRPIRPAHTGGCTIQFIVRLKHFLASMFGRK
jgi:hypothetical protein